MLSSLLKDKKTKKAQLVVSSSKSQKPSPRARMPWHGGKGTGSSINKTNCGGNLCDKQEKKEGEQTLTQPFMITLCENCDTERRRDHVGVKRPKQLKRTDRSYLPLRSSTIFFFPLLWRRGFLPAVSSHPLSDGRPQLASCFSLTNGNFTVLHQSVVFTSLSPLSPVPELACLDSSSNVGLVQVSAGDLCGFDTIHTTFARSRKRCTPCGSVIVNIRERFLPLGLNILPIFECILFPVFYYRACFP